ncbi:MAG: hypothetical protein WCW03_03185 [Candidatus Paceibacterota bacterium]|jgi:hypothetical protein
MKINNGEIESLMRVMAESLRQRWEKVMIQGQSLLTAKQERETALAKIKQNDTKSNLIQKIMFGLGGLGALFVLAITYLSKWGVVDPIWVAVIQGITFSMVVACIVWLWCLDNKNQAARQNISNCDEIFARLGRSVNSLNCLGQGNPYWDVIDEPHVKERLVRAAYRILDAQADFETIRIVPNVARFSVIHTGNWIEHCEGMFDRILNVATHDFGLTLDKGEIFKQASAQLAKDNAERATANS